MPFRKQIEHLEYRRALWLDVMGLLKAVHRHILPGRRFGPDLELLVVYGAAMVVCFSRGKFVGSTDIARYLGMPRETVRRHLNRLVDLGPLERDGHKFRLSPSTEKMPENVVQFLSDQVASAAKAAKLGRIEVRKTVRRHVNRLVDLGPLERDGHKFRLSPSTEKMPENVVQFLSDQVASAATVAKLGRIEVRKLEQEAMISLMDSPALLWVCKPDGTGMIHNPAWCDHYGMSREEAVERWKYTAHPDDVPALLEPWLKSLATAETYEIEVRRRDRTGEYHWYRTRAVPVFKDGKIIKWSGANTELR